MQPSELSSQHEVVGSGAPLHAPASGRIECNELAGASTTENVVSHSGGGYSNPTS